MARKNDVQWISPLNVIEVLPHCSDERRLTHRKGD
jgi:hypothetical protein